MSLPWASRNSAMRLLLVGKSQGGRSATGNTLLGRRAFESRLSSKPVTQSCQKEHGRWGDEDIEVIDTADIFYAWGDSAEVCREILSCVELSSPGPHALLLVTQLDRFTQEDQEAVQSVQDIFGPNVFRHTVVVFTHGEELVGGSLHNCVTYTDNRALHNLIQSCGRRYCGINNRADGAEREQQRQGLMEVIQRVVQGNGGRCYSNEMYRDLPLMEEKVNYHMGKNRADRKRREQPIWRTYLDNLLDLAVSFIVLVTIVVYLTQRKH